MQLCKLIIDGGQVVGEGQLHNSIRTHHGKTVENDNVVVVVVSSNDDNALLPIPEPEANTIGESTNMFLLWPLRLIEIMEPIQPITVG